MGIVDDILAEPRVRGRARVPVSITRGRDLTESDLALLQSAPRPTAEPRQLQRIRDSHHALARALAGGMGNEEASIVTGYDPSRISVLKDDPAFKALVDFYRSNLDAVFADLHQRMAGLSLEAASRLRDLLEDDENQVSAGVLLDILKVTADRTGYAPTMKAEVKTLHLTPEDLRRLSHETNENDRVRVGPRQLPGPDSTGARAGDGGARGGKPVAQASLEGCAGAGEDL